jgi:hypothetical protein
MVNTTYVVVVYEASDITSNMVPLGPPARTYREQAMTPEDAVMQVSNDLEEIQRS